MGNALALHHALVRVHDRVKKLLPDVELDVPTVVRLKTYAVLPAAEVAALWAAGSTIRGTVVASDAALAKITASDAVL